MGAEGIIQGSRRLFCKLVTMLNKSKEGMQKPSHENDVVGRYLQTEMSGPRTHLPASTLLLLISLSFSLVAHMHAQGEKK